MYSKITLTKFQLAINIAAAQLFTKSKISPAVKGATANVVKSIVLKTALRFPLRTEVWDDKM